MSQSEMRCAVPGDCRQGGRREREDDEDDTPTLPGARLLTCGRADPPSIRTLAVSGPVGHGYASCWECASGTDERERCARADEPNPLDNRAARATHQDATIDSMKDNRIEIFITCNHEHWFYAHQILSCAYRYVQCSTILVLKGTVG